MIEEIVLIPTYRMFDICYIDDSKVIVGHGSNIYIYSPKGEVRKTVSLPPKSGTSSTYQSSIYNIRDRKLIVFYTCTVPTRTSSTALSKTSRLFTLYGFSFKSPETYPSICEFDIDREEIDKVVHLDYEACIGKYGSIINYKNNTLITYATKSDGTYVILIDLKDISNTNKWIYYKLKELTSGSSEVWDLCYFKGYIYVEGVDYSSSDYIKYYIYRIKEDFSESEILDEFEIPYNMNIIACGLDSNYDTVVYTSFVSTYNYTVTYRFNFSHDGINWDFIDYKFEKEAIIEHVKVYGKYLIVFASLYDRDTDTTYSKIIIFNLDNKSVVDEITVYPPVGYNYYYHAGKPFCYKGIIYFVCGLGTKEILCKYLLDDQTFIDLSYELRRFALTLRPYLKIKLSDINGFPLPNRRIEVYNIETYSYKTSPTGKLLATLTTDNNGEAYFDLINFVGKTVTLGIRYRGD